MTILAAYLDDKGCYFGSDTQMSDLEEGPLDCGPKWIVWEKSAFGLAGYFPGMNLLQNYIAEPLDRLDLVGQIREILNEHGYEPEHKSGYESWGCYGYYVTATEAWDVDELYSLLPLEKDKLHLMGSGSDAAKGADWMAEDDDTLSPTERIINSVDAAIAVDFHSGGRVYYGKLLV